MIKLKAPSAALVVACIALLVALTGTAVAAAPPVKRALFANNAAKLQGKTAAQVASMPGPANSVGRVVNVETTPFTLNPGDAHAVIAQCNSGERAVSGGFTSQSYVLAADTIPTDDGGGWQIYLMNLSGSQASGIVDAICMQ